MNKYDYARLISNSQSEVTARLNAILLQHKRHTTKEVLDELEKVIDLIRQIKRSFIFMRNDAE